MNPLNPHGWQDRAACQYTGPELFFGPDGERQAEREARERAAKRICQICPVREECRDYALTTRQQGVWGGLGEAELKAIWRAEEMNEEAAA